MATTTENLGLKNPSYEEMADIGVINDNMKIIDKAYGGLKEDINNKIITRSPINLFNKSNVIVGKFVSGNNGEAYKETVNSAVNYIIIPIKPKQTYIVTGTSFYTYILDKNNTIIEHKGSSSNFDKFSFTTEYENAKFVAINYKPSSYPTQTYMVVEGNELPSVYTPYFDKYYKFNGAQYYATLKDLDDKEFTTYHVGVGREYESFIKCIKELSDITSKKVIYVDGGEYNLFEEIGGKAFCDTIPNDETDWEKYSVIIPPNTTIIGLGNVVFNFTPTLEEIGNGLKLLSPINVQGTCHLENITINASNCRYCIHDETEGNTKFTGAKKSYKNVHCIKKGSGLSQAYACGFDDLMEFSYENCIFESTLDAFSMHNRGTASADKSSRVNIKECVFIGKEGDNSRYSIRFGNINWREEQIKVFISNSYMSNPIKIWNETSYGIQNFDVTMLMCNKDNIDVVLIENDNNRFVPKIYN